MAVAIPLLVAYAAGAAGVTATVAGIAATAAAVVAAKTGISEKVNKAASNVFGEDLVKVANIAGAAYMAYSSFTGEGMFGAGAGGGEAAATSTTTGEMAHASLDAADAAMGAAATPGAAEAAAAGDLSAMGVAQPATAGVLDVGAPAGATVTVRGQPLERVAGAGQAPSGVRTSGTEFKPDIATRVGDFWNKAGDQTRAALITVGGNTIAGSARSAAEAKQLEEQRRIEEERRRRFQTGSGILIGGNAFYGARAPSLIPQLPGL